MVGTAFMITACSVGERVWPSRVHVSCSMDALHAQRGIRMTTAVAQVRESTNSDFGQVGGQQQPVGPWADCCTATPTACRYLHRKLRSGMRMSLAAVSYVFAAARHAGEPTNIQHTTHMRMMSKGSVLDAVRGIGSSMSIPAHMQHQAVELVLLCPNIRCCRLTDTCCLLLPNQSAAAGLFYRPRLCTSRRLHLG